MQKEAELQQLKAKAKEIEQPTAPEKSDTN